MVEALSNSGARSTGYPGRLMFHIFFWFGVAMLIAGVALTIQRWQFFTAPTTDATVVEVDTVSTGGTRYRETWRNVEDGHEQHKRILEYRVGDQVCRHTEGSSSEDASQLGATFKIAYNASNPCGESVLIEGPERWLGFIIVGSGLGWCILWLGIRWLMMYTVRSSAGGGG